MPKILLDTSIIIDFLRQKDKSKTLLYYFSSRGYELYISIVTHAESYVGKSIWEKKPAMEALEKVLSNIRILALDEKISKEAGKINSENNNMEIVDAIIASTAIFHKLQLATLNVKDFEGINQLKLYPKS